MRCVQQEAAREEKQISSPKLAASYQGQDDIEDKTAFQACYPILKPELKICSLSKSIEYQYTYTFVSVL